MRANSGEEENRVQRILQKIRLAFASIQVIVFVLLITGAAIPVAGQVTTETVIQKATEQFESTPLKTISLDNGIWVFTGDGGNVTAIVDDGSTLLIDSGLDSRVVS
jgi:hypothetical protein